MKTRNKTTYLMLFLVVTFLPSCWLKANTSMSIENLRVEYMENPIGIDVSIPRFSWQMKVKSKERDYFQTAYQLIVTNTEGEVVWDSKKTEDDKSLNITYSGKRLEPSTRYTWDVKVWNQKGEISRASSWFETGLMNPDPDLSAWDGATWIGGTDDDLVLYSPYLSVFKLQYKIKLDSISNSKKASFIFGANDSRLMDKNKNIFWVQNKPNESFIKLELDILNLNDSKNKLAKINVYRVGYHPADQPKRPFKSLPIPLEIINNNNKYQEHQIFADIVFGSLNVYIGEKKLKNKITKEETTGNNLGLNLNPIGVGNNHISFPMLAEIGFSVNAGQKASFSDLKIKNYRTPSNVLFSEDLISSDSYHGIFSGNLTRNATEIRISNNAYSVYGGEKGATIIADPSRNSMPMLRTTFHSNNNKIDRARLYVTARGVYEIYLNGQRIGNDYFNPGLTQYNKTHMYQTYDVTASIQKGTNALGAKLGEGWWSGNITYRGENWNLFGDRQSLLAKLVIHFKDGTMQTITTNPDTWHYYNDGPLIYGSFFQGEVYDSSKEPAVEGWTTPVYDDRIWKKAVSVPLKGTAGGDDTFGKQFELASLTVYENMQMIGQVGNNASIVKELSAIGVEEVRPGVFVYDMGQNMVGVPKILIPNGTAGEKIILRFAEVKYPDLPESGKNVGMIMLENIRAALTQDIFILKKGKNILQPRFTFHGYRFIEITGIEKALPLDAVKGMVISSVNELASSYKTSNQKVNKLWENITWSLRGNFLSIPTDCPQRNERMGWGGDISVFARTSTFLADASQFLNRHLLNMRDSQREDGRFTDVAPLGGGFGGILWGSAGIVVAWESYQQYGDTKMLKTHYNAMKNYLAFLESKIDAKSGIMNEGPLGDWLSPEGNKNDNTLIWEAYYIYDLHLMSKIATILGNDKDASVFREKCDQRKDFFNKTYIDTETYKTIKSGFISKRRPAVGESSKIDKEFAGQEMDTQVSYAVPLGLGIVSDHYKSQFAKHLAEAVIRKNRDDSGNMLPEYSLMTGFIGTASISKALSDNGYDQIAYRLLQQTSYPSWLYPVNQGATTIWERLNSYTVENGFGGNNAMNSFNHYSFGAIGAWMYNYSLGIERNESHPGFKHFILRPTPDPDGKMTYAKGHYDSMYGRIESGWKIESNKIVYSATVPANTTATLYLPATNQQGITEGGKSISNAKGLKFIKLEKGRAIFRLKSGKYRFVLPFNTPKKEN